MKRYTTRRAARAFTLIELLLVLVILTVLAGLIVPKFVGQSQKARITAAKTDLSSLATALDAFEVDNGRYPTTAEGLQALMQQPAGMASWTKHLDKLPNDPWGNPYVYRCPGSHNTDGYDLYSFGPDGQDGSEDDVTNWSNN